MKKTALILIPVLCLTCLAGCGSQKTASVEVEATVSEDAKYHSATVSLSPEEFEKAGFTLGDSCDVSFESGTSLTDVPYYNGYYVKTSAPVIVSYPGFDYVLITYNNEGIWEEAGLEEGDGVTISLNTKGKYLNIQEVLGQDYSFDRFDYESDEEFCNYRALSGGKLKADFLFRGASPVDDSRGRAAYTDNLIEHEGIKFILDLADTEEEMKTYMAAPDCPSAYTDRLYEGGRVALLGMSSSYESEEYKEKLVSGLRQMLALNGPVYIHCMEGKDRTGFVCCLLEALAGASYEEMQADYMKTYENYYKITKDKTPEKYQAISDLYFDSFLTALHRTEDKDELVSADYTQDAEAYLISGGMTKEEVQKLKDFILED